MLKGESKSATVIPSLNEPYFKISSSTVHLRIVYYRQGYSVCGLLL